MVSNANDLTLVRPRLRPRSFLIAGALLLFFGYYVYGPSASAGQSGPSPVYKHACVTLVQKHTRSRPLLTLIDGQQILPQVLAWLVWTEPHYLLRRQLYIDPLLTPERSTVVREPVWQSSNPWQRQSETTAVVRLCRHEVQPKPAHGHQSILGRCHH